MLTELIARVERLEERVKSSGDPGVNDDFEEFDDLPFSEETSFQQFDRKLSEDKKLFNSLVSYPGLFGLFL